MKRSLYSVLLKISIVSYNMEKRSEEFGLYGWGEMAIPDRTVPASPIGAAVAPRFLVHVVL